MMDYVHWPDAKVVRRIRLSPSHRPTGCTRHYDGERQLPPPVELVVARHDSVTRHNLHEDPTPSSTYYTFYLDAAGEEMTDLCHATLEEALWQAEREFQIKPGEWEVVG